MAADSSRVKFILLADDDDDDTMLFVEATEKLSGKIKVTIAEDGQQLLNLLESSSKPDIIFLDLNMPKKSGLECLKAIRANAGFDAVPVIMYSTSHNRKDIDASYNAGANYYVVKPYDFEDIADILRKLFTRLSDTELVVPTKDKFVVNTRPKKQ